MSIVRYRLRFILVLFIFIAWLTELGAQQSARLTIRIDLPDGVRRELANLEANDSGQVQFLWEGDYRNVYFWWELRDRERRVVHFTFRASAEETSAILNEADAAVGGAAVRSRTTPPVAFRVVRME